MHRRDVLQALSAGVALAGLRATSPEQLWARARQVHDRLREDADRVPLVLTAHQDATVAAIAERIIPATDTPGAAAARVNEFVDILLAEWLDADDRDRFVRGLLLVDVRASDTYGGPFTDISEDQQNNLLSSLDAEVAALRSAELSAEDHFFRRMKWFTLYGYYTSEIGTTEELAQVIIPGRYDPCAPVRRDPSGLWE